MTDRLVQCGTHGEGRPGFVACVHVVRQHAPVAHYLEPDDDLGEVLCAACEGHAHPTPADLMLICAECVQTILTTRSR